MANNDRVNERYYGLVNSGESHEATRARIHWICRNAAGPRVLDIGCSQGITPILLAREGCTVTGIDLDSAAIRYARKELRKESPPVRNRVRFELVNVTDFEAPPASYDTVILGEILEHFADPALLLAQAHRLLTKNGVVLITVPYGYHPFYDHKQTFYAGSLSLLLDPWFAEVKLEIHRKYLCFAGRKRTGWPKRGPDAGQLRRWMELDYEQFPRIEEAYRNKLDERKAVLDRAVQRVRQLEEERSGRNKDRLEEK